MNSIVLEIIVGSAALKDPDLQSRESRIQVLTGVSKQLREGEAQDRALWSVHEAMDARRIQKLQSDLEDLIQNATKASKSNLQDQDAIRRGIEARERVLRELRPA